MTNLLPSEPPVLDKPIVISDSEEPTIPKQQEDVPKPSSDQQQQSNGVQVFGAPETSTYVSPSDLPESYFTPTTTDLTLFQTSLSRRSAALAHRPLQVSAQRDEEARQKHQAKSERWPRTVIRVRFSDRTVVQREFDSGEKIGAVYDFVRSTLSESYRSKSFTLYQPPNIRFPEHPSTLPPSKKRPLNQFTAKPPPPPKETLMDLQLVPQSVLLVRFEEDELNRSDRQAPLLPHLLATATPLPPAPDFDNPSSAPSAPQPEPETIKPEQSKEKKIPNVKGRAAEVRTLNVFELLTCKEVICQIRSAGISAVAFNLKAFTSPFFFSFATRDPNIHTNVVDSPSLRNQPRVPGEPRLPIVVALDGRTKHSPRFGRRPFREKARERGGIVPEGISDLRIRSILPGDGSSQSATENSAGTPDRGTLMLSQVSFLLPTENPDGLAGPHELLQINSFLLAGGMVHTEVVLTNDISEQVLERMTNGADGSFVGTEGGDSNVLAEYTVAPKESSSQISAATNDVVKKEDGEMPALPRVTNEETTAVDAFRHQLNYLAEVAKDVDGSPQSQELFQPMGLPDDLQHVKDVLNQLPDLVKGHKVVQRYERLAEDHRRAVEGDPAMFIPATPDPA